MSKKNKLIPLYVDLDGTLFPGDLLWEGIILTLKQNLLNIFPIISNCLQGPVKLKKWVSERSIHNLVLLPFRKEVVDFCIKEKKKGKKIILATGAHEKIAQKVADTLGFFDGILATENINLKGIAKLDAIKRDAKGPFSYVGDSISDMPIFQNSAEVIAVGKSAKWNPKCFRSPVKMRIVDTERSLANNLIQSVRPHHFIKNLLIFVPLLAAHITNSIAAWMSSAILFLSFCFASAAVYLINDIFDFENDRAHKWKRRRPISAARLPIPTALTFSGLFFVSGVSISLLNSKSGAFTVIFYFIVSFFYSFFIKKQILADVFTLCLLYVIRVMAGGVATGVKISPWLIAFMAFFFLSLALGKRAAEIKANINMKKNEAPGRGWVLGDLNFLVVSGIASAFTAVLVIGLYISGNTAMALYRNPDFLWAIIPLVLWWSCRVWLKACRGELHEDPVVFSISDRCSWLILVLAALALFSAGPI